MVINKSSIERGFAHGAIYASEVSFVISIDESYCTLVFFVLVNRFTRIGDG